MSPTPSTSGTRSAPGSASQRKAVGLRRVLAGRDVRAGLDEPERLVGELDAKGLVDVAAADAREAPDLPARRRADGVLEAHRKEASRPRQAASTWSSTVSKPSGPP